LWDSGVKAVGPGQGAIPYDLIAVICQVGSEPGSSNGKLCNGGQEDLVVQCVEHSTRVKKYEHRCSGDMEGLSYRKLPVLAVLKVVGNRTELREVLIRVVRKGKMKKRGGDSIKKAGGSVVGCNKPVDFFRGVRLTDVGVGGGRIAAGVKEDVMSLTFVDHLITMNAVAGCGVSGPIDATLTNHLKIISILCYFLPFTYLLFLLETLP